MFRINYEEIGLKFSEGGQYQLPSLNFYPFPSIILFVFLA